MYSLREVLSDVLFKKGSICYGLFPILKTVVQQSKATGFEIFFLKNNSFMYLELAPNVTQVSPPATKPFFIEEHFS